MPNEFSLSFPVILKMVCKTIPTICLNSVAPAHNPACAGNVDCVAFSAVQILCQWQTKTLKVISFLIFL